MTAFNNFRTLRIILTIISVTTVLFTGFQNARADSTILVDNLQPSWTAPGGGGVYSAYIGPPDYGFVSPGSTSVYDGREAGIIKAGLATDPTSGNYEDEGLFAFKPDITIDVFAAGPVTYDVQTQYGENPVWMTIEVDTGVAGDRNDNTVYQHVPTTNPIAWHTVDAAAGLWQKWNNNAGDTTGNPLISLSDVVTAHTGLNVVRAYLRLGMGNSYHGTAGLGTVAWVDKVTLSGVTYDFVLPVYWYVAKTGLDTNEGTLASPFLTIQHAVDSASPGDTIHVAEGLYTENVTIAKSLIIKGAQYGVAVSGRTAGATTETTVSGLITIDSSNVEIDGFTLTNPGQTYALYIKNHTPSHSSVLVSHNIIDNVGATGLTSNVHAVLLNQGPDSVTITHNRFNNIKANTKSASAIGVLDSASTDPSTGLLIQDNSFSNIASTTKGAYGIILNNKAGTPGAQIKDNTFSTLSGGWTHAIGLEGPTPNAVVTGNIFSALTAAESDNAAILFEKNVDGGTVNVQCNRFNGTTFYGVAIHPNDLPGGSNGYNYTAVAEANWWGSTSGPYDAIRNPSGTGALVGPNVNFEPWLATSSSCTTTTGNWKNTRTGEYDDLQGSVDAALSGDTILAVGAPVQPGGAVATTPNITIDLNGKTAGPGSPFLTVAAANITVNGPGTLDGNGSTSPAILVNAGGDNFILQNVEITDWADGVEIASSVESLKIIANWIHDNADAGLQIDTGVVLSGVVTVQGNLFKTNGGNGVQNNGSSALNAQYNSWGDIGGAASGDGAGGSVDVTKPTFSEIFVDMVPDSLATIRSINEQATFTVAVKVDAANLYAAQYKLVYDPAFLAVQSVTDGSFKGAPNGSCTTTQAAGSISVYCTRFAPAAEVSNSSGETISTITFKATGSGLTGNGPWTTHLDLSTTAANLSAGAVGGIKVYVNNGGFGADSGKPGHAITDAEDGQVTILGLANFTGYIDLEGRSNDSGATITVYNQSGISGATAYASGTSASSGKFTTSYLGAYQLTIDTIYYFQVDAPLYLPTTAVALSPTSPPLPIAWANSDELETRPLHSLIQVKLLGGDANDDNYIDVSDVGCIGGAYGGGPAACGAGSSDVNGDGKVDIYDLVLSGGNYYKNFSPWAQLP